MRVAYAGLRRKEAFKALAEKLGFTPLLFPVQATEKVPVPEYRDQVRALAQGVDLFLATTGVGVRDLLEAGKALGLDLEGPLAKAFRLARGAKAARALKEAGLDAMPGGGAEIFAERVRRKIARAKVSAEGWLEIHRTAHELGIPTNATMLYGHIETLEERLDHMDRLRRLQDETGGFMSFIPLAFQPDGNQLARELGKKEFTTGLDDLRNLAVARLYLDNFPHIKGYWATLTPELAQVSLDWGVTDVDGTLIEERIVHMAGSPTPQGLTKRELARIILMAGRIPVERDALYREVRVWDRVEA